jgi:PRC-barrel domain
MRFPLLAASATALALFATAPAFAQGAPQSISIAKVDVVQQASGYRASKMIGTSVVNDANDTIGKVDDVIMSADGKQAFVVLSVGGFLGMGNKLVAMPYESLKVQGDKVTMPGASKDSLKALPDFKYS